jgi:adenosylhomocysteine nucleosidase
VYGSNLRRRRGLVLAMLAPPPPFEGDLLVVAAMCAELSPLTSSEGFKSLDVAGRRKLRCWQRMSTSRTIYLLECGVGLVATSATVSAFLEHHEVGAILLIGVGGAIAETLLPGDLVIGSCVYQHDCVYVCDQGVELMRPGSLHLSLAPDQRPAPDLTCDTALSEWLIALARADEMRCHVGAIVSGSSFVADESFKGDLSTLCENVLLVDMESSAIAQVAGDLNIPFAVAKTVSDARSSAVGASNQYLAELEGAAATSADFARAVLNSCGR